MTSLRERLAQKVEEWRNLESEFAIWKFAADELEQELAEPEAEEPRLEGRIPMALNSAADFATPGDVRPALDPNKCR